MVHPSEAQSAHSAYPIPRSSEMQAEDNSPKGSPPVRRAFSALLPPSGLLESYSDESSFDGPDMSSPAQAYAKRQQVKTIRRCDGTDDFRPLTGATAMVMKESPSSRLMAAGMPGFGDNEAHGKILPCHRVTEDGLMRINCDTVRTPAFLTFLVVVLTLVLSSWIAYWTASTRIGLPTSTSSIVALNTSTLADISRARSISTPLQALRNCCSPRVRSKSNHLSVVIQSKRPFSFSIASLAPSELQLCECTLLFATLVINDFPLSAKHLRAKDRAMNNHLYPKIHFPEVYILEGGYCQYFKASPNRCEPPAYVTMDDPVYAASRREDLDQFRKAKFGRHKSYAYGDGASKMSLVSMAQQPKRNTVPSGGPNPLFAAATAARTRRGGGASLMTLAEDGNTTADADDTDTDIGDSPCPPPPSKVHALKSKKTGRPLTRAETYNPVHMMAY